MINLQRIMNIMTFGEKTGEQDRIPDRAIGPTEDVLYENEKDYNDAQLSAILNKPLADVQRMETAEKRALLMKQRREELKKLIGVYYRQRGWTERGIPTVETIRRIGLWDFLEEETKRTITRINGN